VPRVGPPGLAAQKKSLHASQRDTPEVQLKRKEFQQDVSALDVRHFKFMDESSVNTSMTSRYGRAAGGARVVESVPLHSGAQTTTLAVVGLTGLAAPLVIEGAVNGSVFYGYIAQCVAPTLEPGDILFLDNLSAHKVQGLEALVQARGARVVYLPPYSSDFNPIELAWSKAKTLLRRLKPRTAEALLDALQQALLAITPHDIRGWFAHCGYAIT
jgi:transposase